VIPFSELDHALERVSLAIVSVDNCVRLNKNYSKVT